MFHFQRRAKEIFLLVVYLQVGGLDDVTGVLLPPVQLVEQVDEAPSHQARRKLPYTVKNG